jgi:flagellar basal-body rod protein FlgF
MLDRFAFTSMTGAKHAMGQLANTANNMANVQTPGFREMLSTFRTVPVNGASADSRAFVVDSTAGSDFTPGAISTSNNPLDVAIRRRGMLTLQTDNGGEAYTRAGRLTVDESGVLRGAGDLPVRGEQGPILLPEGYSQVQIQPNGAVYVVLQGESDPTLIDHIKLVDPDRRELTRRGDGLFESAQLQAVDPSVRLESGALEMSNVNVAQAMVQMIEQNRLFDLNIRMVQTAEQNSRNASQLVSLSRV